MSYALKIGKKFTREDFTSLLLTSVNDIDQYLTKGTKRYYSLSSYSFEDLPLSRFHNQMGTGAVDAWKFLMAIEGTPSVMVKAGEKVVIDLDDYLGEGVAARLGCTVSVDQATSASLGLTEKPSVKNGKLELTCTAVGSGKITLASATNTNGEVNGDVSKGSHSIGNMSFSREISIVSRPYASANGGWF